ncbi:TonB-dependent siderophore receptor [Apibacter raozihei]|uniref:TonB-dependent siderophore receptor n=1 Tax=Apibacter raozihei TaxID=2500547 RepID=UPI000FE36EBD|nr:TonB-dependent siderophore receptor [Apibacter raozihei]
MKLYIFIVLFITCCNVVLSQVDTTQNSLTTENSDSLKTSKIFKENHLDSIIIRNNQEKYNSKNISGSLRLDEPILEIPQNIQIVNSAIIKDQLITSMSDGLIKNISGVTRLEHWGDTYVRINMRGSRASAFRDGMNVTSTWGPLTEDMSFVERVEIVKGPSGFMMSNGEPSGIYNVVMKKPVKNNQNLISLMLGSYDYYRGALDIGGKIDQKGKLLYRLNIYGQSNNSFRKYEFNKKAGIAPVLSYQIDDNTLLTLEYTYQSVNMSNIGSYYSFSPSGYASLPRNYSVLAPGMEPTKIEDQSFTVNLQHNLSENWKITAQAAYFNYYKKGSSLWLNYINTHGDLRRTVSIGDAINEMKFGQVFVNGSINTGKIKHRILAGLDLGNKEYWGDWSQTFALDTEDSYNIYAPGNGSASLGLPTFDRSKSIKERSGGSKYLLKYTGIYVQDELGVFDEKLRITIATRYTSAEDTSYGVTAEKNRFTPRLGISYSLTPNTSLYALYDQAFVPQSGNKRDGGKIDPIVGNNIELGAKKIWFDGKWNSSLSVYQITKKNQLSADPDNTSSESYVLQLGKTRTQGVEVDIQGTLSKGFNMIANYAFTESKITEDTKQYKKGTLVPGYAKHVANIILRYSFSEGILKGWGINTAYTLQADRSTWNTVEGEKALPDYNRFDAGISWTNNKITIALNINNLFDQYLYSGSAGNIGKVMTWRWQTEASRNYRLGISYTF